MKLSDNFTLEEMIYSTTAEKYNIYNYPSEDEINNLRYLCKNVLQPIRDKYGSPIIITSGYRCERLNEKVGGSRTSQHRYGLAADINIGGSVHNKLLFDLIKKMIEDKELSVDQLIDESNLSWIHVGTTKDKNKNRNQILKL